MDKNYKFFKKDKNPEAGVTLMLAVLILSAISAISFSVSTILFVEIRVSGELLRTEGAFYGAEALTEEALFKVKRKIPTCPTNSPHCITGSGYTPQIGKIALNNPPPVESPTSTPIIQEKIPVSANSFATAKKYPIYDPANPSGGSGYGRLDITYLHANPGDQVRIYICQFDPNTTYNTPACSDSNSTQYWLNGAQNFLLFSSNPSQSWSLDPNLQQEIIIINSAGTNIKFVQIASFDSGGSPKGLPFVGQTAVDITAVNGDVSRKIQVIVPRN